MAIQTKTYTLSQQVTNTAWPHATDVVVNSIDSAITMLGNAKYAADYINYFQGGGKHPVFKEDAAFQAKTQEWDEKYDLLTPGMFGTYSDRKRDELARYYLYTNLAYGYLTYQKYFDNNFRKRFDRPNFTLSYNYFDSIRKSIGDKGINLGAAISNDRYGGSVKDDSSAFTWKQAGKIDLYNNLIKTKLGNQPIISVEDFKKDLDTAIQGFKDLKVLFKKPQYGISRLWLAKSNSYGPYSTFSTVLVKTEDDAKKLLGLTPKDNPNEAEILNARTEARKSNINLTYASTKSVITGIAKNGTPLAITFLPNDVPDNNKEIYNNLYYPTKTNTILTSQDATDIEMIDTISKRAVRSTNEVGFGCFPTGTDEAIIGSVVGVAVPNQAEQLQANKLQQTPPEKEIVDKEAILEQTELFLAQQNAGLNSTQIQGIVVDGQQLENNDEVVGVGICFLKEVISGVTQSITYSSSIDGKINIPEFGRESVLRVIPPPPFQQKDFGPNEGVDNTIDFVYEVFVEQNVVNTSGGQKLQEEEIELEIQEEEELEPRLVGGTVINAITSEPIAGIDITYGIGKRKVTSITNDSGEFTIKISEPRINQLGGRLDKISEQIKSAQERTLDPQKTFFAGQQLVNEGIDKLGSTGTEQLENYAKQLQDNDAAISQFSNNIITGNIGLIGGTDTPGVISDTGAFQMGNDGKNFLNQGVQAFNNTGGSTGLYGQGILELNKLSAKTADVTQKAINKLTDPLNSQTFQDIDQFKNKLNELQGKLPGRKIVIKGTGKIYKTNGQTSFSDNPTKEVLSEVKYRTKRITPYDSDNNVIQDLGIIKINPRTIGIRNSLREIKYRDQFGSPELKLEKYKLKLRSFNLFQALKREGLKQTIKREILPNLFIQILVPLGVTYLDPILQSVKTDINEVINGNDVVCPNQRTLKKLIKTVNVLNMALTRTYTAINAATTAIKTGNTIIKVLQTSIEVFQFVPFIYAIGTPDTITKLNSDKIQKTKNDLEKGKVINENILLWIMDISSILSKAVDVVKVAQGLLERCLQETKPDRAENAPEFVIDPIVADLEEINNFVSEQATTPITSNSMEINGFSLEIEEESINSDPSIKSQQVKITLPRKRAIAKNGDGIIAIRGEYSFTADTDILIEELRFYIQVNDLKAF